MKYSRIYVVDFVSALLFIFSQLLVITKNPNAKKNEQLLQEIAKFLFFHGYFHVVKRKKNQPLVGAFIDQLCSELALNSCFIIRDIAPPLHFHQFLG